MSTTPFVQREELAAIAIAFRNQRYIASDVLPYVPVGKPEFRYLQHVKGEAFTVPDTTVGRTGKPSQVQFTATELTGSTKDRALDAPVPNYDREVAEGGNFDPLAHATESVMELVELDREKRVADKVFASATYPAANRTVLSGTGQWSDFTNSNPLDVILNAQEGLFMPGTHLVIGSAAWVKLRQHPKLAKAIHGNSGDVDVVTRQQVAQLLELDGIIVGQAWINSAKPGQTTNLTRLWGKHAALIRIDPTARTTSGGFTFGMTARWGDRFGGTIEDPDMGARGGVRVRAGEAVEELITASDAGYFWEDVVA